MEPVSAEQLKKAACNAIDKASNDLQTISDEIWTHPEECFEEHRAHKVLTDFLEKANFPVERHYVSDTGFRSVYGEGSKPNICIIAEYDSLPEIGHACGHNLIAEVCMGVALGIKVALDEAKKTGRNLGTLTILGSPAEEGGGGKIQQINAGTFNTVHVALMAHPAPYTATDITTTANQTVTVSYHGKSSHAAQFPWNGVNALDAAILAYNNISVLRQQIKPTWRTHGIITKGGVKPNIIPEETQLSYYIRTSTKRELCEFQNKLEKCFKAAAEATNCKVDIEWGGVPYENMISNPTMIKLFKANAAVAGLEIDRQFDACAGSTDMGNVSHVVPGIHPFFYIGTDAVNHSKAFTAAAGSPKAQPYTLKQAKVLAMTAIDIYCQPHLVDVMRTELNEQLSKEEQI